MIYLYGAGKVFLQSVEMGLLDFDYTLIDSNAEKSNNGALGIKIYTPEILKNANSDDIVYITSESYYEQIYDIIRRMNKNIAVKKISVKLVECYKRKIAYTDNVNYSNINVKNWLSAAENDEISFWSNYLRKWDGDYNKLFSKRDFIKESFPDLIFKSSDIIVDVGAGPIPNYAEYDWFNNCDYYPVDPLADRYKKMLSEIGINLKKNTEFAMFEALTLFFDERSVDYVIVKNALDHCMDILRALIEAYRILKIDGSLMLAHNECEGLCAIYDGMHQWNIFENNGDLIFADSKNGIINITKLLYGFADINMVRVLSNNDRDMIVCRIIKRNELPDSLIDRYDNKKKYGEIIKYLFSKL